MRLYNLDRTQIQQKQLRLFFEFVDYLKGSNDVTILNQYHLLQLIEKKEYRGHLISHYANNTRTKGKGNDETNLEHSKEGSSVL